MTRAALLVALCLGAAAGGAVAAECHDHPIRERIALGAPEPGARCIPDGDESHAETGLGTPPLSVRATRAEGSGRFGTVEIASWTVEIAAGPQAMACITTTMLTWRTLDGFLPTLKWLVDIDLDGRSELILWETVLLPARSPAADADIPVRVPRVYRAKPDALVLDRPLTRQIVASMVGDYRPPAADDDVLGWALEYNPRLELLSRIASGECPP